jgi:hypothetical protein
MNFFKALFVVAWIYAIFFVTFKIGFYRGSESELSKVRLADHKTKECINVLAGN